MRFICSDRARNGKSYVVRVPASAGIIAPAVGVRADASFFYYTDSSNGGPSLPALVPQSNFLPVGYFEHSSIDFSPRQAAANTEISLSLSPLMSIRAGEHLSVVLPQFTCQALAPCSHEFHAEYRLLSNATVVFLASSVWQAGTSTLELTLQGAALQAGDTADFVIRKDRGLEISPLGIGVNDAAITVSTDATNGPVPPTAIVTSPGIGALLFSSISLSTSDAETFYQASPGLAAAVHLSFSLNRDLSPGETITLELGGFNSDLAEDVLIPTGNPQLRYARWVQATQELVLTADFVVIASMRVELALQEETFGLKLPSAGIESGSTIFKFSTDSKAGPIDRIALPHNMAVGALVNTSLEFLYPMAGHVTAIAVRFTSTLPLAPGDQIEITLPGFSSLEVYPSGERPAYCSIPDPCFLCRPICEDENHPAGDGFLIVSNDSIEGAQTRQPFQAAWSEYLPDQQLVLAVTCGMNVEGQQPVHVILPASVGLAMPKAAIPRNSQDFKIGSTAKAGPVFLMPFDLTPPVGALLDNRVSPPDGVKIKKYLGADGSEDVTAGQIVGLQLDFPADMFIFAGEVLQIELPGFSGADANACDERQSLVVSSKFERASWNSSSSLLALTVTEDIQRQSLVSVNIPTSFGLSIPLNGLEENHKALRAGGQFQTGPIMMTPISSSPSVFVLTDRSLQFVPARVNANVSLHLTFRHSAPLRPLRKGELVTLLVPGLASPKLLVELSGQNNIFELAAQWDETKGKLYLRVRRDVSGELVKVLVPESQGFRLPASGLSANTSFLLLDENVGPALPTMLVSGAIGYFGDAASVSFTGPRIRQPDLLFAGRGVGVLLEFMPSMEIRSGDKIFMGLSGFTAPFGTIAANSVEVRANGSISLESLLTLRWGTDTNCLTADCLTLEVMPGRSLSAFTEVTVKIFLSGGFKLPLSGLRVGDEGLTLASNAKLGPVASTRLPCKQALGSFGNSPRLSFPSTARPGHVSNLTISFSPFMQLVPGDVVVIQLGSHAGVNEKISGIFGKSGLLFSASFELETLALEVLAPIAPMTQIELIIPESAGIVLPSGGIIRNTSSISISAMAVAGSVAPTVFSQVQEVGEFEDFTVELDSLTPGASSIITLSARYSLNFKPGDEIVLSLPGFANGSSLVVISPTSGSGFSEGQWHSFDEIIVVTCTSIVCSSNVKVRVEGLNLPFKGLLENDPRLTLAAVDIDGRGLTAITEVFESPPAGFERSALQFSPALGGEITSIFFSFRLTFDLKQGTNLVLALPDLSTAQSIIELQGESAALFNSSASWMNSSIFLAPTEGIIEASTEGKLEVRGVFLPPSRGIPRNSEKMTVSIDIDDDSQMTHAILQVQPVPGFQEATLSYNTDSTRIALQLTHTTSLQKGTVLELVLPGFQSAGPNVVMSSNFFDETSPWHGQTLMMTASIDIVEMTVIDTVIEGLALENATRFVKEKARIRLTGRPSISREVEVSSTLLHRIRRLLSAEWERELTRHKSLRDRSHALSVSPAAESQDIVIDDQIHGIASIADADDEVGKSLSYAQFTKILEVFATGDNYKRT